MLVSHETVPWIRNNGKQPAGHFWIDLFLQAALKFAGFLHPFSSPAWWDYAQIITSQSQQFALETSMCQESGKLILSSQNLPSHNVTHIDRYFLWNALNLPHAFLSRNRLGLQRTGTACEDIWDVVDSSAKFNSESAQLLALSAWQKGQCCNMSQLCATLCNKHEQNNIPWHNYIRPQNVNPSKPIDTVRLEPNVLHCAREYRGRLKWPAPEWEWNHPLIRHWKGGQRLLSYHQYPLPRSTWSDQVVIPFQFIFTVQFIPSSFD